MPRIQNYQAPALPLFSYFPPIYLREKYVNCSNSLTSGHSDSVRPVGYVPQDRLAFPPALPVRSTASDRGGAGPDCKENAPTLCGGGGGTHMEELSSEQ